MNKTDDTRVDRQPDPPVALPHGTGEDRSTPIEMELAECHDIIASLDAITDPDDIPHLRVRIERVLAGQPDGNCGNRVCHLLHELETFERHARATIEAFVAKWPEAEKAINAHISLNFARMGWQYTGPSLEAEINAFKQIAKAGEAPSSPSASTSDERKPEAAVPPQEAP